MKNLTQAIAQRIESQAINSEWLTKILNDISFSEGGTLEIENNRIILTGDNGRHEFFQGNEGVASCFESHLDKLINDINFRFDSEFQCLLNALLILNK